MLINELNLIGFGKFKNKIIKLEDGINIIYGKNERGKTTVHKFIEGMFYGYFRPYTKVKRYSEDYDRHLPWFFSEYRGTLKYELDGNIYRIERNFLKKNDEVKMYDDITGDDLTHFLEYDKVTRLPLPGPFLLGINSSVIYNNTINIEQLGSKTDENLAKEVKDSLANLGGSLDEDISIKNALSSLDFKRDEIGTERRTTSPYGQLIIELESLYTEREKAIKLHNEMLEIGENLKLAKDEMEILENNKREITFKIAEIEKNQKIIKYNKVVKIKNKIDSLEKEKKELKEYSNLSFEDYEELLPIDNQVKLLKKNIVKWKDNLNKIKSEIKTLEKNMEGLYRYRNIKEEEMENISEYFKELLTLQKEIIKINQRLKELESLSVGVDEEKLKDLGEDIYYYEDMEREKDKLEFSKDKNNLFILKDKEEASTKEMENKNKMFIIFLLLTIVPIGLGLIIPIMFFVSIPFAIGLVYTLVSKGNIIKEGERIKNQISLIENSNREIDNKIQEIDKKLESLLFKYKCKTRKELKQLYSENYESSVNIDRKFKEIEKLNLDKKELYSSIESLKKKTEKYKKLFNIKEDYTIEDIKNIKKEYKEYIDLQNRLGYKINDKKRYRDHLEEDSEEQTTILDKMNFLLEKNNSSTIEELKEGLNNKEKLDEINGNLKLNYLSLEKTLDNRKFEDLEAEVREDDLNIENNLNEKDIEDLKKDFDEIEDNINNKKINIAKLEESTFLKSEEFTPLVEIDEKIESLKIEKKYYEDKLASINLAKDTIEDISKNVHKEFAPTLNKEVSNLVKKITNKYEDIKINEDIDIVAVEPQNGEIKNIHSLSGGTIDQLYFATRFAIIDIVTERKVPLILDDCFIQYDSKRLRNILELLGEKSKERQVILFTCHEREGEILEELNIDYNLIEI